jgi:transposase-like protein
MHSSISNNNNTSTRDISAAMSAIDKAIADLGIQESINISATARKYGIIPCTLNRRWHGVTTTAEQADDGKRFLNK